MAKDKEPHVSTRQRREARRNAVLRTIIYDTQHDSSSRVIAERVQRGRPELGRITAGVVTYFRRRYSSIIHGTPRK